METRLHSYETYLYKFMLPIIAIPWNGLRSFRAVLSPGEHNPTIIGLAILVWCAMLALILWYALRVKTVFMTQDGLRIHGYVTDLEISFSDIASVKHNWFWKNATLQLKTNSAFGATILFIPRRRVGTEGGNRFTLDLLRELISQT
jgi:hypothetical protein